PGECTTNADCDGGVCVDGSCFEECTTDAQCPEGNYCYFGRCRLDDRPNPLCVNDSDCAAGSVCRNGACRSPCVEHSECPRFDVALTFCLDGVCATSNDA